VFRIYGELATLAPTGMNDLGWIALGVLLLQVAVATLAVRAARNRRRGAQHRAG
jgi:hypothetical protein